MPTVRSPCITNQAPQVSMIMALNSPRKTGTALSSCVLTPSVCVGVHDRRLVPAKRAKKPSSMPPALSVSIICRPAIVVP